MMSRKFPREKVHFEFRVAPPAGMSEHHPTKNSEWLGRIIFLRQPLMVAAGELPLLCFDDIRVYNPFALNEAEINKVALNSCQIPDPVIGHFARPDGVVTFGDGDPRRILGRRLANALRLDTSNLTFEPRLDLLLRHLRSISLQWWILQGNSPFDPFELANFDIDDDFGANPTLHHYQNGVRPGWRSVASASMPFGFEMPIDAVVWSIAAERMEANQEPFMGVEALLDAFSSYVQHDDRSAIVKLALALECFELFAREDMISKGGKKSTLRKGYGAQMMENPVFWLPSDRKIVKDIFADRGSIAHAKASIHSRAGAGVLEEWLDLGLRYMARFINQYDSRIRIQFSYQS